LTSVTWHTGQSGAPPDSYCSLSGARLPSKSGTCDRCSSGLIGAPDTVRCTPDSLVHQLTVGAVHVSREDYVADRCSGDRWLTGQSGAPPDSPVNYSHVAPMLFPRVTSSPRTSLAHRTLFGGPPNSSVCQTELKIGCTEPSFSLFLSSSLVTVYSTWITMLVHKTIHQV
jgi:hypothetical protein